MSAAQRLTAALAALLVAVAIAGCGGGDGTSTAASGPVAELTRRQLGVAVEKRTAAFLEREGTALRISLHRFLGPRLTTKVESGSAICRPGSETPSITDPKKYPFACVVRGSAKGQGLEVGITLGFVGTELSGGCWRAVNERVSVTTTAPALLSAREARRPVNQIADCAQPE